MPGAEAHCSGIPLNSERSAANMWYATLERYSAEMRMHLRSGYPLTSVCMCCKRSSAKICMHLGSGNPLTPVCCLSGNPLTSVCMFKRSSAEICMHLGSGNPLTSVCCLSGFPLRYVRILGAVFRCLSFFLYMWDVCYTGCMREKRVTRTSAP